MQKVLKILDKIAPQVNARFIYSRISKPKQHKLREGEERSINEAQEHSITFKGFTLKKYAWGQHGDPIALLVHGWEGRAGNFGAMIPILMDKGYHVIAYDGPSHGKSSRKRTNMFEYAEFISSMIKAHNPQIIISHSFGTVSTQLGLLKNPQFTLEQWIIVTTPYSYNEYIHSIINKMGLSQKTLHILSAYIEKDASIPLEDINMATLCPRMNPVGSVVIVHSVDDKILPYHDAERTSRYMKNNELIQLKNIGHYKILWSTELKKILSERINLPKTNKNKIDERSN